MPAKLRHAAELLAEIEETLQTITVYESQLVSDAQHLHGLCDYGTHAVHIDPRPSVVEYLLHEALHARYPSWSERRVDREAVRLLSSMSTRTLNAWYRRYQRIKRTRARPVQVDED